MKEHYDFAFSFAGEDRTIVEEIKNGLNGFSVFYDFDYQVELCGKDLYNYLRNLYMQQTKYVVCFISKHYKAKVWTNLEFSAIKERLIATFFASDFLIPVLLDEEIWLEDLPSFIGFYKHRNVQDTILFLKEKYTQSLNEDFYLDNIIHFRNYLLQEIVFGLSAKGFQAKCDYDCIKFSQATDERVIYLRPEEFTNLPCLLLYENKVDAPPTAMILWNRGHNIVFSWILFTLLSNNLYRDISLDELIRNIQEYLIRNEG